ncbi:MAG: SsrA-binding protein SmpB [Deltaproteobacteria bacterium]|nr:SsrA-binding protein SmpB [Deltaproteobacteria bacterium]
MVKKPDDGRRSVAKNRKAFFEYSVLEKFEAGIMLQGTEVKSLRDGKLNLGDAFATVDRGEAFLHNAHIGEYTNGSYSNHEPLRRRKLLLHRHELDKLEGKVEQKGLTLVPLEVYFLRGKAKVELGLCRGKQAHDKRHAIRDRDVGREVARSLAED